MNYAAERARTFLNNDAMRVLITRPQLDSEMLSDVLFKAGVESQIEPLLDIVFNPGSPLGLGGVQALLMTSANGVRAFCKRSEDRTLPVYAVGDASARAAQDNGFDAIFSAAGDVDALAALVRSKIDARRGALLHCAGTNIAGDLAAVLTQSGYIYRREVIYSARTAAQLSPATALALKANKIDGVLLFSPRTADVFATLIEGADLTDNLKGITVYCLSANVDNKICHLDWRRHRVADTSDQDALISMIVADLNGQ